MNTDNQINSPSSLPKHGQEKGAPMKTQAIFEKSNKIVDKSKDYKKAQSAGIPQKSSQSPGISNFQSPGIKKNAATPQKTSQNTGTSTSEAKNQVFNLKGKPILPEERKNESIMQKDHNNAELHPTPSKKNEEIKDALIEEEISQSKPIKEKEMNNETQESENFEGNRKNDLKTESIKPEPHKIEIEEEISGENNELAHENNEKSMNEVKNSQNLATSHPNAEQLKNEEENIENLPKNNKGNLQKSAPFNSDKEKLPKEEEKNNRFLNHKRTLSETNSKPQMTPNLALYLGIKSSLCQWDIKYLLNRKGDYDFLEGSHSFVQWLFPNHFSSAFNSSSYALTLEEARRFRTEEIIAKRLMIAYDLMFDFYGFQLKNNEIRRIDGNFKERYNETIAYPTHNHLRIRRILAHLNVVGFRDLAIKVVKFLREEVQKPDSGLGYIRRVVMEVWSKYGEIDENNEEQVKSLLSNCYPMEGVYGKKMWSKEGRKELLRYLQEPSIWYSLSEEEKSDL